MAEPISGRKLPAIVDDYRWSKALKRWNVTRWNVRTFPPPDPARQRRKGEKGKREPPTLPHFPISNFGFQIFRPPSPIPFSLCKLLERSNVLTFNFLKFERKKGPPERAGRRMEEERSELDTDTELVAPG
jgi:hypothetical protein